MKEIDAGIVATRPGTVKSKTLRIVCRACNGGWMSRLEDSARPFLTPMMRGNSLLLNASALATITRWAAMKVMIAEFHRPAHSVLTAADRAAMRERGEVPSNMTIRFGRCTGHSWQAALVMQSAGLRTGQTAGAVVNGRNIQTTTIGFGQVLLHAVVRGSHAPDLDAGIRFRVGMIKLWPSTSTMAYWPPPGPPLSAREAEYIARRLQLDIRGPHTQWAANS
jgi:hypothetical protein